MTERVRHGYVRVRLRWPGTDTAVIFPTVTRAKIRAIASERGQSVAAWIRRAISRHYGCRKEAISYRLANDVEVRGGGYTVSGAVRRIVALAMDEPEARIYKVGRPPGESNAE